MRPIDSVSTNKKESIEEVNEAKAAGLLNISKRTLQRRRHQGTGPRFIKHSPRCIRYRLDDLVEYYQNQIALGEDTTNKSGFSSSPQIRRQAKSSD